MKRKADKAYHRRQRRREPQQRRARDTVEAVLDAVVRILKRGGIQAVTTNRVAEVAGVSIGSIYQYFPDKRAIFAALHERHIREIDRVVESKLMQHTESPLDTLMRAMIEAMIDAMIDAHTPDPELYELLSSEVPHRAEGTRDFAVRLHGRGASAPSPALTGRRQRGSRSGGACLFARMTHLASSPGI